MFTLIRVVTIKMFCLKHMCSRVCVHAYTCVRCVLALSYVRTRVCLSMFLHACSPPQPSNGTENVKRLWRQRGRGERDSAWTVMRQDSFTAVGHAAASGWI